MIESVFKMESAQLTALWHRVFGDPETLAEEFLRRLPDFGCGFAAVEDGRVLGAAYWLELAGEKLGYLYAVAVHPEARGRGLGAELSRACFEAGRERGAQWRTTAPAEPSLFGWYERILGVKPALYRQATEREAEPLLPVSPITPEDYAARREALMGTRPHFRCVPEAMRYEAANCRTFGGGLFAVGEGIAAAIAASVGAWLGCERVTLLQAADEGKPFLASDRPFPPGTVWNLAFD